MNMKLDMFDSVGAANKGATFHVIRPDNNQKLYFKDDKTKPVKITVLGLDSDKFTELAIESKRNREHLEDGELTPQELAERDARTYAKMTVGWENMPDSETGETIIKFSEENAYNHYLKYKAMREQVHQQISDRKVFIQS